LDSDGRRESGVWGGFRGADTHCVKPLPKQRDCWKKNRIGNELLKAFELEVSFLPKDFGI